MASRANSGSGVVARRADARPADSLATRAAIANWSPLSEWTRSWISRRRRVASARAACTPGIASAILVGIKSTRHRFIVMELVEGRTLAEIIPEGGLPVSTAVRYAVGIAGALGHAHARGIVHRDLKSLNVMIADGGHPKVLDLGIATRTPEHAASDTTVFEPTEAEGHAGIAGTLAYLSPEA